MAAVIGYHGAHHRVALERAYQNHARFVWRVARGMGCDPTQADDLVQEVFTLSLRRLEDPLAAKIELERPWFYGVARRVAARRRRSESRRHRFLHNLEGRQASLEALAHLEPDQQADAWRMLRAFAEGLDPTLREIFWLSMAEGMSGPEIARTTATSVHTVNSRLRRVRTRLAEFQTKLAARDLAGWNKLERTTAPRALGPEDSRHRAGLASLAAALWADTPAAATGASGPSSASAGAESSGAAPPASSSVASSWVAAVTAGIVSGLCLCTHLFSMQSSTTDGPSERRASTVAPSLAAPPSSAAELPPDHSAPRSNRAQAAARPRSPESRAPDQAPAAAQPAAPAPASEQPATRPQRLGLANPGIGLIRAARKSLAGHRHARALQLTTEYLQLHPQGNFAEAALILRVQAYCRSRQASMASDVARILRVRFPDSAWLAGRVSICGRTLDGRRRAGRS